MFILYGALLGLLVGALLRGRLSGLGTIPFRWAPLALAGLAFQVVLFSGPVAARIGDLGPALYVASTLVVLAAVLRNWRIPGVALVAVGAICNLAAILANGGYMPSTPEAYAALGLSVEGYSNSALVDEPRLLFLGDIFAMPRWLPFANVFSIGDVLIALGIAWTIAAAMRRARPAPASRAATVVTVTAMPVEREPSRTIWGRLRGFALPALAVLSVVGFFTVALVGRGRP
jgi:hypothetical protein